ncbi:MAG TPA: ABC transporter permease [Longimicrobiales bacterium]
MRRVRTALERIRGMFTGHRADAELREEMAAHLAMETEENIRRGMAPAEARRRALLSAGGLLQAEEAVRDQRGLPWLEAMVADLRYALRTLRHSPAFAVVVVLTLALGIGANTAIFSVVRGVLLKPLPHRDGERLVYLRHQSDGPAGGNLAFSVPEVRDFRNGAPSLGGIAEYSPFFGTLHGTEGAKQIDIGLVTGNFFDILGLSPVLGRLTQASDDGSTVPAVMVLSHEFWQEHFGGDAAIVGQQVRLGSRPVTVIGVVEPAPFHPERVDAFLNMVASEHHLSATMIEGRTHRMTELIARLAPGATLAQARLEAEAVHERMRTEYPEAYDPGSHYRVSVYPYKAALGARAQLTLWLLMGAAAFVLIISTANVANLTLMRGVRREHELVVRAALGAGSGRLRRLILAENLVLALLGGALGVLIAIAGVGMLTSFAARYSPRASEIRLDLAVLGFTLAVSLAVALLLSLLAALPREGTFATISGGRRTSGSLKRQRLQRGLVVAQVAASVVLLAGAGLLTRTLLHLADVSTGLRTEEVLTMSVQLLDPSNISPEVDAHNKQLYDRIRAGIGRLPGVIEVAIGSTIPLRTGMPYDIQAEGRPLMPGEAMPQADLRTATPEYFRAAGIPLLAGREFHATDRPGSGRVVVVNRALVDRFFPNESPIGRRIAFTGDILRFTPFSADWRTIVGVVGNTQDGGLDAEQRLVVFTPWAQEFSILGGYVIRAERDAEDLAGAAQRIVRRVAPQAPIEDVMTVAQIRDESVAPRRLNAVLVSSFGILALLIAAVGIAGVLAFSVSARIQEIGIRMSLGATRARVQGMILSEGGVLVVIGLVLGIAGAFLAAGVIRGLLFGVEPHDTTTFVAVASLMAVIGAAACWIPAVRAARVDPAITMRAP